MKQIKKTVSILLSVIMVFSLFTIIPLEVNAAVEISYIDEYGSTQTAANVTELTSGTVFMSNGWYAVTSTVTNNNRITCFGDVYLILCDGAKLTAPKGIAVNEGNSLTIYAQSEGTGELTVSNPDNDNAGIGGDDSERYSGQITINGGVINSTGSDGGAAIGGSHSNGSSTVTINRGTVTATGGDNGAGIGGGYKGAGIVTINGGTVNASGYYGAAIGGGDRGYGTVAINGGNVTANSSRSVGIGGNSTDSESEITLDWSRSSDTIYASSYSGEVTLLSEFNVDSVTLQTGVVSDLSAINGKTLYTGYRIEYLDSDGSAKIAYIDEDEHVGDYVNATEITVSNTSLTADWYVVTKDIEMNERINCDGEIRLILCNNATLTVHGGIHASNLTVYGQSGGTGNLIVDSVDDNNAGIGGDNREAANITVNGGTITAVGGKGAAGIGGGYRGTGTVTINGGTVNATGGKSGAGIGGGASLGHAYITINGGTVNATGGANASGIGSGETSIGSRGYVTINSGKVTARYTPSGENYEWGNAIGTNKMNSQKFKVNLSWSDVENDFISADSYGGNITLMKYFVDGSQTFFVGTADRSSLEGKTLLPYIVSDWSSLHDLITSDFVGDTLTLDQDYTAQYGNTALEISEGKTLTLDLNGHTLDRNLNRATSGGNAITNRGTLTITDSSEDKTGTITGAYNDGSGGGILNYGELTVNGGSITGNYAENGGGGIFNKGTATVNGGSITGNTASGSGKNGGGIWTDNSLTVTGGTIQGNIARTGNGGGISFNKGGFDISGSPVITGNTASNSSNDLFIWSNNNGDDMIFISDELSADARIGVRTQAYPPSSDAFTVYLDGYGDYTNFVSNYSDYAVRQNEDGEAAFMPLYTITANQTANGTLNVVSKACEGDEITLDLVPDVGYSVDKAFVNGEEIDSDEGVYSFVMPAQDTNVSAEYIRNVWFTGHSLTLKGDIGVNFYLCLTDEDIENGAAVDFSWTVEGVEKIHSVTLTNDDKYGLYYKATVYLPVAEMSYDITASLRITGDSETHTDTYSVKRYADYILTDEYKAIYLNDNHTEEEYNKLETLIKTMLDYGAKAQMQFGRDIDNLVNEDLNFKTKKVTADMITTSPTDMTGGLDAYGLEYKGSTIVYLTKTSIRHYYKITDSEKFNAVKEGITFDGKPVDPVEKNGQIYFELQDVPAQQLDIPFTLHIGTDDYNYAVLDYVYDCLKASNVSYTTKQLVYATYWYNQAAKAYFA